MWNLGTQVCNSSHKNDEQVYWNSVHNIRMTLLIKALHIEEDFRHGILSMPIRVYSKVLWNRNKLENEHTSELLIIDR